MISLAVNSTKKILKKIDKNKIDFVLFVTQTKKNDLKSAACIIQNHFSLKKNILALDLSTGCSGFVQALKFSASIIDNQDIKNGLIICSDTYTKNISYDNRSSRTIFSDGSAAILIGHSKYNNDCKFSFGSDGSGSENLCILEKKQTNKPFLRKNDIYMNGNQIALFAIREVPNSINNILNKNKIKLNEIDLIFFHQASKFVIDNLIVRMKIPKNKVFINYKNIGNTISSSIPIALKEASKKKYLKNNAKILLVGFGVGLSWASTIISWKKII